jgi:pantothenate kinase
VNLEPTIDVLVERARGLRGGPGRPILGITGAPGAGKSTLATAVVDALSPGAVLVPMDGFHLSNDELERTGRREWKGAPDTFDVEGYVALLERLRRPQREPVYAPRFDRHLEESVAGSIRVGPAVPLVVTEGNYLLLDEGPWARVKPLLDEVWFVDVSDATRVARLVGRHVEHGKGLPEAREWVLRSDEANAALVAGTRRRADLVIRLA